jgi:type IV pilus assembly protein PilY1
MLHGIDDSTGQELMAYVPGGVYSQAASRGLHYLTDPNYLHQYYVDLTPSLSDVFLPGGGGLGGNWTTVLIGGLRSGGRGYFALDVTDPSTFSEANAADIVLWEFTSDDDADLGYTFSQPFIGLANDGNWVAIFGNGYNDTGSGEAQLFIVDIAKGIDGTWDAGDYRKITTGVGTALDRNGLATPALADLDGNGTIDRVYAGDLQGNMWAFDLSSANPAQWASAYKSGSTPAPLFTTQSGEPITAKPMMASHPTQPDSGSPSNAPNIMVYFGSGQYLVDADKSTTSTQSFYGVWDKGDNTLISTDLVEQTFDGNFSGRVLTRNPVDYSLDHGWYFDLDISGERSVTSPVVWDDTVFFNTFVPQSDPCGSGGFGYKFAVDMVTGGSPLEPVIDSNNDGVIDDNDYQTGGGSQSTLAAVYQDGYLPEPVFIEDLAFTGDQATKVKALKNIPIGRFSWQELIH